MATNPQARFDKLFSGIDCGWYRAGVGAGGTGTVGCFIHTTGIPGMVPAGNYLLSCYDALCGTNNFGISQKAHQPSIQAVGAVNPANEIGYCVYGVVGTGDNCAIATVNRPFRNEVPAAPNHYGKNTLMGTDEVDGSERIEVYKFGAFSRYTTGTITGKVGNTYTIINNEGWAGTGDYGSLLIRKRDHVVLGLNYMVDGDEYIGNTGMSKLGYAFTIQSQFQNFCVHGGVVRLA